MRCLVTGGAGFIGSNLVDRLLSDGHSVTVVDDLSTGKRENLRDALAQGASLQVMDVANAQAVDELFAATEPEVVFHLAAQVDVRISVSDPARDAGINVIGTLAVLEASRRSRVRRFVNTSTGGGLYGDADVLPTPEDSPIRPLAPYGQGKLAAEGYCDVYDRLHGLSAVSLRYGNVYGPRQDIHGEAGVVAIFCGNLVDGRAPTIYGDGRQTRDWVDVSDVVRANLLAAQSECRGPINIGHGRETSVLDLVTALSEASGRPMLDPVFAPERPGEVRRSCLDVSRARTELGWEAEVQLVDGLRVILSELD
jgi:UDP-glucose 4-epimerase